MSFWKGKNVLVTGHTGFKGSWLSLWLQNLGANVIGYSLSPPTNPNLFNIAKVKENMASIAGDIRDYKCLVDVIKKFKPEIVFHLAAQSLVRKSYKDPIETFSTNIMGTVNLLEAFRQSDNGRVVVNITTDKCYENKEWLWGYRETDSLGGYDPYSCSKACSELITNAFRKSFYQNEDVLIASARAGNVIGGGDWGKDRLVPDIIRAIIDNEEMFLRNPHAIRPWQHVLEPLNGYMLLAEKMWKERSRFAESWNFGPSDENVITVGELAKRLIRLYGNKIQYIYDNSIQPYETQTLRLDSSKAKAELRWKPILGIDDTLKWTVDWHKAFDRNDNMKKITLQQIKNYQMLRRQDNARTNMQILWN